MQWTRRILREGSSSKSKMCVSLQRRAIQNFKMYVLLQRRAQKCMNPAHDVRGNPRHTKITISPQFRTSDQHEVTKRREGRETTQADSHFTSVLDVRRARSDERVTLRRRSKKIAFHHSFGRPMSTKRREGCDGDVQNSHFTSVLDVR